MVNFIKRDNNDIYKMPILGFLFKNKRFLLVLKVFITFLFFYAIIFGFINPSSENIFTTGLFWGLFWPFFMVVSLGSMGRIFCGICPHGFLGKYLTKWGLNKSMPKALQNPMIGGMILILGWWLVYYMYPNIYKTPNATALFFTVLTLIAFVFFFVFKQMSYCKSICPIGILTRAFSKVGFTWLGSYKSACNECKTFDCAKVCSYNLKPFTFDTKNSMEDCTLCMDCSSACEAISFKVKKPSFSLFEKFKYLKSEVWIILLITASISITMGFHHALGRSAIVEEFIWVKTARYFESFIDFGSMDTVGLFAFLYAILATVVLSMGGMYVGAKIMKLEYKEVFYTLGFAFAPLFIIGGLSHLWEFFFYHTASNITNAFIQAFALPFGYIEPLATRKDTWVHIFGVFNYLAAIWAFVIIIVRLKLLKSGSIRKMIALPFVSALILFYLGLNFYKIYIFKEYGVQQRGHNHAQMIEKESK
ncbi:MAG: 4Fe-4S binding protein [Arcobacteraceae bacterium]